MANVAVSCLVWGELVIRATVSEVKDGMSAFLRRVKAGESVLITERRTPVAYIVPVGQVAGNSQDADGTDNEARMLRLERAGIVVRRGRGSPLDALGAPLPARAGLMKALLDERSEERREGER